jgi:hypothetical protein
MKTEKNLSRKEFLIKTKSTKNNMIVIDSNCLSKKDVFHLKDYFDKLANNENKINIKCKFKFKYFRIFFGFC